VLVIYNTRIYVYELNFIYTFLIPTKQYYDQARA